MRLHHAATACLLALALTACVEHRGTATSHKDSKEFASAPAKLVVLDVRSLDVEVEIVDGGAIGVAVEIEARASAAAAARRWVERNTPAIKDSPTRLEITTPRRSSVALIGFIDTEGVVRIKAPAECRLEVRTASGAVTLRGAGVMAAPVRSDTGSGDVTVRGGVRELLVDTSSGDVRVAGEALAVVEADTASGDITLDAGADRVAIDTSSGECVLRRLRGALTVSSQSGDVDARWLRLASGDRIGVEASSGDVTLRLPGSVQVRGEVVTSGGSIESEAPGDQDRRGRRLTLSPPAAPAEATPGTVEVSVRTGSGDVRLLLSAHEI